MAIRIPTIDCTRESATALFAALREKLSPRGNVVSEAGRQRTIDLFGEPLTPQQVVERTRADIRRDGLAALLSYTRKLDGKDLTAADLRVSSGEFTAAHRAADPGYLDALRRIRANIVEFQRACLTEDVAIVRHDG